MQRITKIGMVALTLLAIMMLACAPRSEPAPVPAAKDSAPTQSAKPGWEQEWERTLVAARKEGQLNFYSGYNAEFRQAMAEAMATKYSIKMESVTGSTEDVVARVLSESRSRVDYADVQTFSTTSAPLLQSGGVFQPLEKSLILPEVVDPKNWYRGQLTWLDPDEKKMIAWRESATPSIVINTDLVKPEEMSSWDRVLDPKWKGKILMQDPTASGAGQRIMTWLIYAIKNRDFVNAFVKQEPEIQRGDRLLVEWVARGRFPILIGGNNSQVYQFMQARSPLKYAIPTEGAYTTLGDGCVAILKNSPHPNAAKVFINFFLSKEGQTITTRKMGNQSLRVDVPTDHMDPAVVRQPGTKYFSAVDKGYLEKEPELKKEVTEIFNAYLKK
ncbi:MAG: extracellular solute-binding protein [Chloroflexi bacterium]|nr:extracellular solute-binding protein [Chloroflexota bacterium]